MTHFLPEAFHRGAGELIGWPAGSLTRPVRCSSNLVEAGVVRAKTGVVIPLINWSRTPIKGLRVTLTAEAPEGEVRLASGRPFEASGKAGNRVFVLDLDVADALILR
jgi:hypothetical protein